MKLHEDQNKVDKSFKIKMYNACKLVNFKKNWND